MKTNRAGRELIKSAESLQLVAYPDPGSDLAKACQKRRISIYDGNYTAHPQWAQLDGRPWTIGYGDTQNVWPGLRITEAEAEQRFEDRLAREFEPGVMKLVQVPLTGNEFSALVSFAYNAGLGIPASPKEEPRGLCGSTLLRKLNAGDYAGVSGEWAKWNKSGGVVMRGLIARREAERALFETPGDGDE